MAGNNSTLVDHFASETCTDVSCVLKTATICSITAFTVVGNLMSLITLGSTPSLRNCHGYIIVSLSIADFISGIVASMSIYPSIINMWPYGDALCLVAASVEATTKKISPLLLTFMSIERYIAVVHPLRYSRIVTKKFAVIGIVICWVTPIVFFIPLVILRQIAYKFVFLLDSCTITYQDQVVFLMLNTCIFVLPSMITVCVTSCLVWIEFKNIMRMRALLTMKRGDRATQTKRSVKFFRMSRIMVCTFYGCWAPHVIVGFTSIVVNIRQPLAVYFALYWLYSSNSFWNVLIYFVMNDAFRKRMLELIQAVGIVICTPCRKMGDFRPRKQPASETSGVATLTTNRSTSAAQNPKQ